MKNTKTQASLNSVRPSMLVKMLLQDQSHNFNSLSLQARDPQLVLKSPSNPLLPHPENQQVLLLIQQKESLGMPGNCLTSPQ